MLLVTVVMIAAACVRADPQAEQTPQAAGSEAATPTETEPAEAGPWWEDVTDEAIGTTGAWSNKVELADIDGDGHVDLLFADGGDYDSPGQPVVNQVWINDGDAVFEDRSQDVLGGAPDLARVIKVRDVNADGHADIFVGTTYQTQSRLLFGRDGLAFEEVTETHLPQQELSVGDAELGDVDGDGDLDLVLADWGPGNPMENDGGRTRLWLNDGKGRFSDATKRQMPGTAVRFSWELELVDADNDWDLDLAVSCKQCDGSFFFTNDGKGVFSDTSQQLPQFPNNYDFEVIDLDGDGFQDLLTVNDGPGFREQVFRGRGDGRFEDATDDLWPAEANPGCDDNMIAVLDANSDGMPDVLIGSLDCSDRLLLNDGTGRLVHESDATFGGGMTDGTLGIAVAHLDADDLIDVVQAQGEQSEDERVYLGAAVPADTAAPVISQVESRAGAVHARVHDNKTPVAPHDFRRVYVRGPDGDSDMQWYGEALWRAPVTARGEHQVCAQDRAGNESCAEPVSAALP